MPVYDNEWFDRRDEELARTGRRLKIALVIYVPCAILLIIGILVGAVLTK